MKNRARIFRQDPQKKAGRPLESKAANKREAKKLLEHEIGETIKRTSRYLFISELICGDSTWWSATVFWTVLGGFIGLALNTSVDLQAPFLAGSLMGFHIGLSIRSINKTWSSLRTAVSGGILSVVYFAVVGADVPQIVMAGIAGFLIGSISKLLIDKFPLWL